MNKQLPISICISLADHEDPAQKARQDRARESWLACHQNGLGLPVLRGLPAISVFFLHDNELRRTGLERFGRPLPFVRDLLDRADYEGEWEDKREWSGDYWIGTFNSDIVVTPRLIELVSENSVAESIHVHRTDVDDLETRRNAKVDVASVDGWLIKNSLWEVLWRGECSYPDFMLGEPGWGYGTTVWAASQKLRMFHLNKPLACLHVRHRGEWKKGNGRLPGTVYCQGLYKNLVCRSGLDIDPRSGDARSIR